MFGVQLASCTPNSYPQRIFIVSIQLATTTEKDVTSLTRTTFTVIINAWDCLSVQCIVQNVVTSLIHQSPTHWPLHVTCTVG